MVKALTFALALLSSSPAFGYGNPAACGDAYRWIMEPMVYVGQKCVMRFVVLQVVDKRTLILEIEGDDQMGRAALFYGRLVNGLTSASVIDGQRVAALVEITGTATYVTPFGDTRTVPSVQVRHLTPQ